MKKITIVHPIDDLYGATKILSYVVSALSRKANVEVWYKKSHAGLSALLEGRNICTDRIIYKQVESIPVVHSRIISFSGLLSFLSDIIKFSKLVFCSRKNYKESIFYINTYAAGFVCLILHMYGFKNYIHCHENQSHKIEGRLLASLVRKYADKIICVSNVVKKYTDGNNYTDKSIVLWNGIENLPKNYFLGKIRPPQNLKFAIVGRIMHEKGHWFLADAIKILRDAYGITIKVDVYGDAPPNRIHLFNEYRDYIKRNELEECLCLKGFVADADLKILNYDVVLIPSQMSDPFPTTVIEGLRARRIVISTNHGGAAEIIDHKINGFLIEHNDAMKFALMLKDMVKGTYNLQKIADAGRFFYENNLMHKQFEAKILSLLIEEDNNAL
ncbi:glycosyltransferase family 4 protein [Pantoea sp. FN0305]|uniref:glycosyltransferase family 4 protein n=1 Tax=Pantoea sp. FN0305 TaxID=3418559 RepID=UPI003CF5790A